MDEDLPTLIARKNHLGVLRYIRMHRLREPQLVIHHGNELLFSSGSSFFPFSSIDEFERLNALEQLCLSALDVHDHVTSEKCLSLIRESSVVSKESARGRRLLAMCLESAGDLEGAEMMYDELLKDNAANVFAMKRKYCILRAQVGKEAEAKEALNKCIDANQGDAAGWMEMKKLCMEVGDYKGAVFCLEEVVLTNPLDASLHCQLGEAYVTLGGVSNLKLARKHMAQSLELCPGDKGNLRALYGLVSAAGSYLEECARAGKRREVEEDDLNVAKELVTYGAEKIVKLYKGNPTFSIINEVMQAQTNPV